MGFEYFISRKMEKSCDLSFRPNCFLTTRNPLEAEMDRTSLLTRKLAFAIFVTPAAASKEISHDAEALSTWLIANSDANVWPVTKNISSGRSRGSAFTYLHALSSTDANQPVSFCSLGPRRYLCLRSSWPINNIDMLSPSFWRDIDIEASIVLHNMSTEICMNIPNSCRNRYFNTGFGFRLAQPVSASNCNLL